MILTTYGYGACSNRSNIAILKSSSSKYLSIRDGPVVIAVALLLCTQQVGVRLPVGPPPMRTPKKKSKAQLAREAKRARNKAWKELSAKVRAETPYCQRCGNTAKECRLNVHHLRARRFRPDLLLDENGLIVLCPACHQFAKGSAHKDPGAFYVWLSEAFPEKWEWLRQHQD